jgi:hypothetical protein
LIGQAAKAASDAFSAHQKKKAAKLGIKETKRATMAHVLEDAMKGSDELHSHGLERRAHLGKRRSKSLQDTSDLVRGSFNI